MKKKCYSKELCYIVPEIKCSLCKSPIKIGEGLYIVVLKWGDGKHTCKKCYDEYEIDWSMHERETIEEEKE